MSDDAGLTVAQAAARLGVSERTLRRYAATADGAGDVRRRGVLPFRVYASPAGLRVFLTDVPVVPDTLAGTMPVDAGQSGQLPDSPDSRERERLETRLAAVERDRDALAADKAWLQGQLDQAAIERAELRRLLGNAQQQLGEVIRALPPPAEHPVEHAVPAETGPQWEPENPPVAAVSAGVTPADFAQALKEAGIKKKQRRKLLERLAAAWRR